jgi:hypothetical protein
MTIYVHARQFPHLAGKAEREIRILARRAMDKHPRLIRTMRLRNAAIMLGMTIAGVLLGRRSDLTIGAILVLLGAVGSVVILCWNLVWLNTVVYKLTAREITEDLAS